MMLTSVVLVLGTASAAIGGVSWVLTFTPWTQWMPSSYFVPFFTLAFPLSFWAVFVLTRGRRRKDRRRLDMLQVIPPGARVPFGALFVAVWISLFVSVGSLPGQPEYEPGSQRYYYDDHGTLVPATRAGYLHAIATQDRLFLGAALVFTSFATIVAWGERKRQRDLIGPGRTPRPRPVGPRPKVPVPAWVLAVTGVAGLAFSIVLGLLLLGRVTAYNNDALYLRAGHPVSVRLAPDDYVVFVGCTVAIVCPPLEPGALSVSASGGAVPVIPDPSPDRLTEAHGTFRGELSFRVSRSEVVRVDLSARLGEPVFVVPSIGEEVHALAGWIVLAGLSVLTLGASLTGLVVLLAWRLGLGAAPGGLSRLGR